MSTTLFGTGDPDNQRIRHHRPTFSPASSSSSAASSTSSPSVLPPEFALSSKSSRILSLQTYLATFPEWSSSTRLVSLYSEFDKLKETNPFGYEANVNWWRAVILGAARHGLLSTYRPYNGFSPSSPISSSYGHTDSGAARESGLKPIYEPTGSALGILELDLDHLGAKFQKNSRRPHSLPAVMNEMTRLGEVVPRSEFLPWAGVGWTGWIFHKVVKAPLLWSLKQLSISDSGPSPTYSGSPTLASTGLSSPGGTGPGSNGSTGVGAGTGSILSGGKGLGLGLGLSPSTSSPSSHRDTYIILPFVQEAANRILKLQQESTNYHASDNLMTFADFRQKFSRTALLPIRGKLSTDDSPGSAIVLTDRDLEILIRYMQFELKVLVSGKLDVTKPDNSVQDNEMIVKFATKDSIQHKTRQEITTADRGIIELRETCKRLDKQVQDIEERISELTDKAKACVRKNQRSRATFALRQRKNLDDVLNKRLKSLDTLSSILFRIQSSETDAEVLQSYKLGASTLASVMATRDQDGEKMLSRDNIDSTMDRLADVFADQEEVDQAMSEGTGILLGNTVPGGVDEDELVAELNALMDHKQAEIASPMPSRKITPPLKQQQQNQERPITIKRTSPKLQGESTLSPSSSPREHTISSPGKRVAEIPQQAFVKQRRVSQTTIHSHRRESQGRATSEHTLGVSTREEELEPPSDTADNAPQTDVSRMDTDQVQNAVPGPEDEGLPTAIQGSTAVLSSQEERDLDAMLNELEDIKAPEDDQLMESHDQAEHIIADSDEDSELEDVRSPAKTRKDVRMMEHS
ncbi:hypothetical protein BG011_003885 [Mortierella polycephala]|uniref:Snf7-domain-containing protein n=1 Tax=Mortierella polycephala TaxID=41804 RepID=A0A9P6Q041_9FUNG|nr:hypothetical protein BG011_003885 [Mortierella polycephala]